MPQECRGGLRQNSRALWLKEGGRNSNFFHRTANAHKRYNLIDHTVVHEDNIVEPHRIKWEIISFYKNLYTETEEWRPSGYLSNHPVISE